MAIDMINDKWPAYGGLHGIAVKHLQPESFKLPTEAATITAHLVSIISQCNSGHI